MSRHYLALIPLLTLMAISPAQLIKTSIYRSPAQEAIEEVKVEPTRYEVRAKKVDLTQLAVNKDITLPALEEKASKIRKRIEKEMLTFKKDIKDRAELEAQDKMLNEIIMDTVVYEAELKQKILEDKFEKYQKEEMSEILLISKENLELLLSDASRNTVQVETLEALKKMQEGKKEEVVTAKEEPKREEVATAKEEPKKEEAKKEVAKEDDSKKTDYEKRLCEIEDKNKALVEQVNKMVTDQTKIIDIMLSMQHQMLQRPAFTPYYAYPQVQQPVYQYLQQPQMGQYSLLPQQHQQVAAQSLDIWGNQQAPQALDYQPIMGVNPQAYTQYDPRYSTQANLLTGQFGGTGQMGFNFGGDQQFASQFQQPHLSLM